MNEALTGTILDSPHRINPACRRSPAMNRATLGTKKNAGGPQFRSANEYAQIRVFVNQFGCRNSEHFGQPNEIIRV